MPEREPSPPTPPPPDSEPSAELYGRVEGELHRLAAGLLRGERAHHTLQPTALMHEAWLRLAEVHRPWQDRAHFVRAAVGTMRRVLVEHGRARAREKRGAGAERVTLSTEIGGTTPSPVDVLVVDEALERLSALDPGLARIAELRVFGGLDNREIATVTGSSLRTVERDWRLARAVLRRALGGDGET